MVTLFPLFDLGASERFLPDGASEFRLLEVQFVVGYIPSSGKQRGGPADG